MLKYHQSIKYNEGKSVVKPLPKKKKKQHNDLLKALSFFSQVGTTIAACVFIGVFVGRFLDNFFGTSPWLLLILSLLGAAAAFKALFDLMSR